MPYVVTHKMPKGNEISLDQILFGEIDLNQKRKTRSYPGTVTKFYQSLPEGLYNQSDIQHFIKLLKSLSYFGQTFPSNMSSLYRHYEIPKRSGGFRPIDEPKIHLYSNQVELRSMLEHDFKVGYHSSAFAYCKGRSPLLCVRRHQAAGSKWFLKLDFSNFFGNTNFHFVLQQLSKIAPFSEVLKTSEGETVLKKALSICFLNDGLPQGTPISPMLTNLIMIPIDHEISKRLHSKGYTYTRYADDMQISHRKKFNINDVISIIEEVLRINDAPYLINQSKTRFGSIHGRNWNLGLMLNSNHIITIGHRKHKIIKAKLCNFILDEINKKPWIKESVEVLAGQVSYMQSIEFSTTKHILEHLNEKYKVDVCAMLHKRISENSTTHMFKDETTIEVIF